MLGIVVLPQLEINRLETSDEDMMSEKKEDSALENTNNGHWTISKGTFQLKKEYPLNPAYLTFAPPNVHKLVSGG